MCCKGRIGREEKEGGGGLEGYQIWAKRKEGGKWVGSKTWKRSCFVACEPKNAKSVESMRRRDYILQQWRPLATVCDWLLATACARAFVCLVNCALTTCLIKASFKVARDSFGSNKMCQFFCQNLLFKAQAVRKWNNIRGSPCSIFQKMGSNIAIFDLLKYGVNGKTVTCLPFGGNFDNF